MAQAVAGFAQRPADRAGQPVEPLQRHAIGGALLQPIDDAVVLESWREADIGDVGALLGRDMQRLSRPEAGRRFEPGELDAYLPKPLRVPDTEPLYSLPR